MQYCEYLFLKETDYVLRARDKKRFIDCLGEKTSIVLLMSGIRESIGTYFLRDSSERNELRRLYNALAEKINVFFTQINEKEHLEFAILDLFKG